MPGGGWPGTFHDVGRGIDALRGLADRHALDLSRVVTVGHSAGGHLALWAAGRHRVPDDSDIWSANPLPMAGALSLAGIVDLRGFVHLQESSCGGAVVTRLLGGLPRDVPQRCRAASPLEMLPVGLPQLLITGSEDPIVPPSMGTLYRETAAAAGDRVEEIVVPGAGHFEVIAPGSAAWPAVEQGIRSLLHPR